VYLVFAGIERFLVEIVRAKDDRLLGPFTIAQLASVVLVSLGALLMVMWRRGPSPAAGSYLETGSRTPMSKR
jgi:phosphatidylglycerol:prolipoprotein diacylglycerol transferase